ncbi:hypothetical protein [Ilumatobacter nonamiensis]|uniref:hypothetical protein n=1 Tax=Ilumatobacter nonamiensis TaxID=467093 RepID=UPI00034A8148|nr:hypothetical protein [Ilumatobacter nonamiensis]
MSTQSDETTPAGEMHECVPVEPHRPRTGARAESRSRSADEPGHDLGPDLDAREAGTSPARKPPGPPVRRGRADDADAPLDATTSAASPDVPEAVRDGADDDAGDGADHDGAGES